MFLVITSTLLAAMAAASEQEADVLARAWEDYFRLNPPQNLHPEERVRLDAYMERSMLPPGWQVWRDGTHAVAAPPGWALLEVTVVTPRRTLGTPESIKRFFHLLDTRVRTLNHRGDILATIEEAENGVRNPFLFTEQTAKGDGTGFPLWNLSPGQIYIISRGEHFDGRPTWSSRRLEDELELRGPGWRQDLEMRADKDGEIPLWYFTVDDAERGEQVFRAIEKLGLILAKTKEGEPIYLTTDEEMFPEMDQESAIIEAISMGLTLAYVPDHLESAYGYWYLVHPVPDTEVWHGIFPSNRIDRDRLANRMRTNQRVPKLETNGS